MAPVDAAGLEDRFRAMYEAALPQVYGFLSFRTGGDVALAEDLTAETFAAAVSRFRAGDETEITTGWLLTVARRRLIDHWRRGAVANRKMGLIRGSQRAPKFPDGERDFVIEILDELPAAQRQVLVLQHLEGMSVQEIADIIGRSVGATESLLARARRTFRRMYEEADDG
jgi:RNA polymerase sigma-70 factor (ECF subfamily)